MKRIEPLLAVHGGAGHTSRSALSPADCERVRAGIDRALAAGQAVLGAGGAAVDAVLAAVVELENDVQFNAGRGAVLRSDGTVSLDAAVMVGSDRSAGAVAGVRRLRNPILAAERVRVDGRHVLLAGPGADAFGLAQGLADAEPEWFVADARRAQLEAARAAGRIELDAPGDVEPRHLSGGTVGAVARDGNGHLAAATSTGGMTNADPARIGDSPILGAGTWAEDGVCAVSATGAGEFFARSAFAHEIAARVRLVGGSLEDACTAALERVLQLGGRGGCVAIDASGAIALPLDTASMPRGCVRGAGQRRIAIFRDDRLTS